MHKQTKIFALLVKDFMHAPRVCVEKGAVCADIIQEMSEKKAQCCVVVDGHGKLAGILRTEDILKKVVFKVGAQTLIDEVMDDTVQTIGAGEYLYHAIGRMRRHMVREIVVVDPKMQPVGIVYMQTAIEVSGEHILQQIDHLSAEGDIDSLRGVKAAQVEIAHDMFEDNQPGVAIQQLLSHVNNDIYARIIHDNIKRMEAEGWGKPPVEFCVLVMGSGGRGENYLYPDQDNGFILDDYPDEEHNRVDQFFRELSSRMCKDLNEVGFTYCRGNVMALNPVWRKSISQWVEQVENWGKKCNHVAMRLADIFFDFQSVWGKKELANDLRDAMLHIIQKQHFFLQEMCAAQSERGVALNMFGRLATEESTEGKGKIDLKYRGLLPLIEAVRLLSLKEGIEETHTLQRIEKLHQANILDDTEEDFLTSAFSFMTQVLLKRQVSEFESREPVTRFVDPKILSKREKENLLRAFKHIDAFRRRIKAEFTGDVF